MNTTRVRPALVRPQVYRQLLDSSVNMTLRRYAAKSLQVSNTVAAALATAHYDTNNNESVVLTRFAQPINPTLDDTEIWIDMAGGSLLVRRVEAEGRNASITGDVSATVRYTLMSVDWDPFDPEIDWDNQPLPAGDDPRIEVKLQETDKGWEWYDTMKLPNPQGASWYDPTGKLTALAAESQSLKFDGCANKLYYGVRAEIVNLDPGTKYSHECSGATFPSVIWAQGVSPFPVANCGAIPDICDGGCAAGVEVPFEYHDATAGCTAIGVATSTGQCRVECSGPCLFGWQEYDYCAESLCQYSVSIQNVVPDAVAGTVDVLSTGSIYILSKRPRVEIPVIRREAAAGVATLTLASPHGLPYGTLPGISLTAQPPYGVDGVDDGTAHAITSISAVGTTVTVTTATAHGLKSGQYVHLFGAPGLNGLLQVSSPTATSFKVAVLGATTSAARAYRGWARPAVYDRASMGTVTIPGPTQIRYTLPSALSTYTEAATDCTGIIYMA